MLHKLVKIHTELKENKQENFDFLLRGVKSQREKSNHSHGLVTFVEICIIF